jgi:hypothetical protein
MFGSIGFDFPAEKTAHELSTLAATASNIPPTRSAAAIEILGTSVVEFSGHHGGYRTHPKKFGERLLSNEGQ